MISKTIILVLFVYFVWLNSQGFLINRHVNTGLTHISCQLLLSILFFALQRQKGKTIFYSCFCFLINLFFIYECAHHNGYWCMTHPLNKKWLCDRLREIKVEFEKHEIPWKLTGGSALGAFRDYPTNHFGIPYEKDEDIMIDIGKKSLSISIADAILFYRKPWFQASSEARVDRLYEAISKENTRPIKYCGTTMPVSIKIEDELRQLYGEDFMISKMIPSRIGINRQIGCAIYLDSHFDPPWMARLYFITYGIFFAYNIYLVF